MYVINLQTGMLVWFGDAKILPHKYPVFLKVAELNHWLNLMVKSGTKNGTIILTKEP
jgi:hypothetical protein